MGSEPIEDFQARLGLRFSNRDLLVGSLTHSSFINEQSDVNVEHNERLEFLGDAVLDLIIGEVLFRRVPDANEGYLTRLRAALVRTESLAEIATKIRIGGTLLMGKGEEESGGRMRSGNLCAAFEALVGAIYIDAGIEAAKRFSIPLFEEKLERVIQLELDKDPKSVLQEICQSRWGVTPKYETLSSSGPEHAKEFVVAVYIRGQMTGEGVGSSKQIAAQVAAQHAIDALQQSGPNNHI